MDQQHIEQAEIVTRLVKDLHNWEDNPRTVKKEDFERLKKQITRLGTIYKPLIINQQNFVLGGNMRLRAFKELGIEEVKCCLVKTDNRAQMMELALSDNDQIGITDEEAVAAFHAINPIDTELFAISSQPMKLVSTSINELFPDPTKKESNKEQSTCRHCPVHCSEDDDRENIGSDSE